MSRCAECSVPGAVAACRAGQSVEAEPQEHSETSWPFRREACKPHTFLAKACWSPGSAFPGRELQVCRVMGG